MLDGDLSWFVTLCVLNEKKRWSLVGAEGQQGWGSIFFHGLINDNMTDDDES